MTLALTGCQSVLGGGAAGPAKCIGLTDPPESVVDALGTVARKDASAGAWVIGLDRHYQKLDKCRKVKQ